MEPSNFPGRVNDLADVSVCGKVSLQQNYSCEACSISGTTNKNWNTSKIFFRFHGELSLLLALCTFINTIATATTHHLVAHVLEPITLFKWLHIMNCVIKNYHKNWATLVWYKYFCAPSFEWMISRPLHPVHCMKFVWYHGQLYCIP